MEHKMVKPAIIGICSPPGGGKSSLCRSLAEVFSSSSIIHYDHFQHVTEQSINEVAQWSESGGDYDQLDFPELAHALSQLKLGQGAADPLTQQPILASDFLLFETPLGRAHAQTGKYIDVSIWIDVPLDVALARVLKDAAENFLTDHGLTQGVAADVNVDLELIKKNTTHFLSWQVEYINNYSECIRDLLISQREKLLPLADIVVDGSQALSDVVNQSIKQLENYL
jgi:hypothetical protein